MIKHCLGNSQINSVPAWSFLNFSLQNTRKCLRVSSSRYYSFTARNERNFRPWKLTFSLTRSIKVHRRALVPYSQPSLWKIRKRINNSQHLIPQRDNIHARNHDTCVDIWRQDGAICSKHRKIVPYHGSALIPRLTVSVPHYGSWFDRILLTFPVESRTKSTNAIKWIQPGNLIQLFPRITSQSLGDRVGEHKINKLIVSPNERE